MRNRFHEFCIRLLNNGLHVTPAIAPAFDEDQKPTTQFCIVLCLQSGALAGLDPRTRFLRSAIAVSASPQDQRWRNGRPWPYFGFHSRASRCFVPKIAKHQVGGGNARSAIIGTRREATAVFLRHLDLVDFAVLGPARPARLVRAFRVRLCRLGHDGSLRHARRSASSAPTRPGGANIGARGGRELIRIMRPR